MRQLCRHILFLVNDRVDLALEVGADGVHLGQEDLLLPRGPETAGAGQNHRRHGPQCGRSPGGPGRGADYLGVSPIFSTATKADAGAPTGVALLAEIRRRVTLPLVAIGGITLANAPGGHRGRGRRGVRHRRGGHPARSQGGN